LEIILIIIGESSVEITVEKIAMIRENQNPKNTNLNLDIDWFVEYTNTDQDKINFNIVLKSSGNFNLNFKVEGIIILDLFEEFVQEDVSQIIFHHACNVLMDMISITRDSVHILSKKEYSSLGGENTPNTLYN
jgi:hypothetical protein